VRLVIPAGGARMTLCSMDEVGGQVPAIISDVFPAGLAGMRAWSNCALKCSVICVMLYNGNCANEFFDDEYEANRNFWA
jgi:hypothetical protein